MKNTLFFFSKLLFVSIANNFSLYLRYNLSYLLLTSQNTNTQCIQQCIFIKIQVITIQVINLLISNNPIMVKSCKTAPDSVGSHSHRFSPQPCRPPTPSVDSSKPHEISPSSLQHLTNRKQTRIKLNFRHQKCQNS